MRAGPTRGVRCIPRTKSTCRSFQHYLALRSDPDSALRPQRDSVRAKLSALERQPHDRP